MVVTCEGCKARFKFDENLLKPQGIKVHCSKCRHTFVLKPPAKAEETQTIRTGSVWESAGAKDGPEKAAPFGEAPVFDPQQGALDDPLADVPGFDPDQRSLPAPDEEEKKALAGLSGEEFTDAAIEEALQRFQVPEAPGDIETSAPPAQDDLPPPAQVEATEPAPQNQAASSAPIDENAADRFDDLDPFGVSDLVNESEVLRPIAADGNEAEENTGEEQGNGNFDWEQVSFTGDGTERGAEAPENAPPAAQPLDLAMEGAEENSLELDEGPKAPAFRERGKRPREHAPSARTAEPEYGGLELDLSNVAQKEGAGAPAELRQPRPVDTTPATPPVRTAAEPERKPAKPRAPRRLVQPFRSRARQQRPRLALPGIATLAVAAALGLVAAAVGALVTYGPFGGNDYIARPAGGGNASAALAIEDAHGVMVDPVNGGSRYVVTGTARWESEPEANYVLKGVITGPEGEVLERRTARLGGLPEWKIIEEVDPDLFAANETVPREGDIPFTVLFTPDPAWRGEVRFELATGP